MAEIQTVELSPARSVPAAAGPVRLNRDTTPHTRQDQVLGHTCMLHSTTLHIANWLTLMLQLGGARGYFTQQTNFLSCCSENAYNCDKGSYDFS